jgi:ubiquinone/menaquinone biosynthesis C-methylase UbiE
MQYLPPVQHQPQPLSGADKYHGPIAAGYDAKREADPKWQLEQVIIEGMLGELPDGATVLDAPCGTGRFFDYYAKRGFSVYGLDKSADMLNQATKKVSPGGKFQLAQGNVLSVPLRDKSVDATVNCRITRWLSPEECQRMVRQMQRVAKQKIIFTARVANHKHARTLDLFEAALDGWRIAKNEVGIDMDYRVLELSPC